MTDSQDSPVRYLRDELGMNQRELSAKAGISRGALGRIEHGERVHPKTAHKIASALGVPTEALRSMEAAQVYLRARNFRRMEMLGQADAMQGTPPPPGYEQQQMPPGYGQQPYYQQQPPQTPGYPPQGAWPQHAGMPPQQAGYPQQQPGYPPEGQQQPQPAPPQPEPEPESNNHQPARLTKDQLLASLPQEPTLEKANQVGKEIAAWMGDAPDVKRDDQGYPLINAKDLDGTITVWANTVTMAEGLDHDEFFDLKNAAREGAGMKPLKK